MVLEHVGSSLCWWHSQRQSGRGDGYQENTFAGTVSGARAVPPGGYFYTQQCWEQAVCSQNRCTLHASHTECDTGCILRVGVQQVRGSGERWDPREASEVEAGAVWFSHKPPQQDSSQLAKAGFHPLRPPPSISQSFTFFFSLEEGSLPEQRPGSTPLAPFARVEDLARLLSTNSSSNFFLLMNLWRPTK